MSTSVADIEYGFFYFSRPYISACVWKCEQYVYEGITASQNLLSCQKMGNGLGQGLQLLN